MKSILEMFKIGYGPDTTFNLVPYRACREIYDSMGGANKYIHHIDINLFNDYARLGKEADIERDIRDAFEFANYPVNVTYDKVAPAAARAPYTFDVCIYATDTEMSGKHRVVSLGGGDYMITDQQKPPYYQFENFAEMQKFFNDHKGISFMEFCCLFDKKKDICAHIDNCMRMMNGIIDRSLQKTGPLDLETRGVYYERRAKTIFENEFENESVSEYMQRVVTAYAYAIGEEINEKCMLVFTPTASTTACFWSVVRYVNELCHPTEERIYNAMCGAALIGSCMSKYPVLASNEVGCQGPMSVGCAMAACYAALISSDVDINELGRLAEMCVEHTLGLICDSVCSISLVPCVQRTASYATRAIELAVLNHSLMETPELVKLDDAITVLIDTGLDLAVRHKRLALGGFKEHASYSLERPVESRGAKQ